MERWFPVQPTDKDQEVQGQIHLEVGRYTDTNNKHYLKIRVIEARYDYMVSVRVTNGYEPSSPAKTRHHPMLDQC